MGSAPTLGGCGCRILGALPSTGTKATKDAASSPCSLHPHNGPYQLAWRLPGDSGTFPADTALCPALMALPWPCLRGTYLLHEAFPA